MNECSSELKLTLEPSVRNHNRNAGCSCESGWLKSYRLDVSRMDTPISGPKGRYGLGCQGHSQSPKATKGLLSEHRNFDLSAQTAIMGEPPGPVMSQAKGGASVVVGVWESHTHGEGRQ
jgi:hypothetical protein